MAAVSILRTDLSGYLKQTSTFLVIVRATKYIRCYRTSIIRDNKGEVIYDGIWLLSWLFSRLVDAGNLFSRVVATATLTLWTREYCTRHDKVICSMPYMCVTITKLCTAYGQEHRHTLQNGLEFFWEVGRINSLEDVAKKCWKNCWFSIKRTLLYISFHKLL